jgi:chromosome segregation ATPase
LDGVASKLLEILAVDSGDLAVNSMVSPSLEAAVQRCEATLPRVEVAHDAHEATRSELLEEKIRLNVAESRADVAKTQQKRLENDMADLVAKLQTAEHDSREAMAQVAQEKELVQQFQSEVENHQCKEISSQARQQQLDKTIGELRSKNSHAEKAAHDATKEASLERQNAQTEQAQAHRTIEEMRAQLKQAEKDACDALKKAAQAQEQGLIDKSKAEELLGEVAQERERVRIEKQRSEVLAREISSELQQAEKDAQSAAAQSNAQREHACRQREELMESLQLAEDRARKLEQKETHERMERQRLAIDLDELRKAMPVHDGNASGDALADGECARTETLQTEVEEARRLHATQQMHVERLEDELSRERQRVQQCEEALDTLSVSRSKCSSMVSTGENLTVYSVNKDPVVFSADPKTWEASQVCSVCRTLVGKRFMNPRHHCRVCTRTVCRSCSASSVNVAGTRQRVCDPCVTKTLNLQESLKARAPAKISERCRCGFF